MDPGTPRPEDIPTVEDAISLTTSRYRGRPRVIDSFSGVTTLGLYKRNKGLYYIGSYKIYETSMKTAYRPDLISLVAYGDWRWWWVILEANDISGLEQVLPNMTLKIPDLGTVQIRIDLDDALNQDIFA